MGMLIAAIHPPTSEAPMKQHPFYGLCATLALVAASATLAQDKPVTVNLSPQNASGEKGTVTFTPEGDKTQVVIKLAGAPSGVPQPAHIHDGSCAKLDPKPRVPLQNVVDGNSTTTLDMKIDDIVSKGGAINVHKSAAEAKTYVACGDLMK
jgi:hypothetical protein